MKTLLQTVIARTLVAAAFVLGAAMVVPASPVSAAACNTNGNIGVQSGVDCAKSDDQKSNLGNIIKTVTNVLLFIIGAIAVIMIIIGGIKYVISNGDSSQITSAKNTILYAVIGLVVALLAYAIVGFVIDSFVPSSGGNGGNQRQTS
jgi:uncharacterized membrane protein